MQRNTKYKTVINENSINQIADIYVGVGRTLNMSSQTV